MDATVGFMVSRIGPIAPSPLLVDHFGPIRDTISRPTRPQKDRWKPARKRIPDARVRRGRAARCRREGGGGGGDCGGGGGGDGGDGGGD